MHHRKVSWWHSERCLVAPAPQLRARIRERLRRAADIGLVAGRRLTVRPQNRPGLNDGLIIPGTEFPRVHEDLIAEPVPLLRGGLREPPDQHRGFLPDQPFTTRLTRRPGTTTSLTIAFPSRCF